MLYRNIANNQEAWNDDDNNNNKKKKVEDTSSAAWMYITPLQKNTFLFTDWRYPYVFQVLPTEDRIFVFGKNVLGAKRGLVLWTRLTTTSVTFHFNQSTIAVVYTK